jgi:protein gp37
MAENTAIEWADHTFNPWVGCTKVSPGCDHCYAESWAKRAGEAAGVEWGGERRRTSDANWRKPLQWNQLSEQWVRNGGQRARVFCASLADVFDNQVPPQWRQDLFELIRQTPHLDWLLLTKRIGNAAHMVRSHGAIAGNGTRYLPDNVWLGASVVNQAEADRDVPKLLRMRDELGVRVLFVSIEPMLGPIDLREGLGLMGSPGDLDWVIVGGESGPGARPMHPDWARSLRDQCAAAGVPFLFKQWGEWCPRGPEEWGYPCVDGVPRLRMTDRGHNGQDLAAEGGNDVWMNRAGKKAAGRQLDGRTHDEFPKA